MTHKPRILKPVNTVKPTIDNNRKKFAFLATETVADYRPMDVILEKDKKTSTNQSTKFQELRQMFGNVTNNDINNTDMPLMKHFNSIGDNINTENEVISNFYFCKNFHKSFFFMVLFSFVVEERLYLTN